MRKIKFYNEDDLMSKILFLYLAFVHGAIGFFLVTNDVTQYKSKVFDAMGAVIPMSVWGMIFMLSAMFYILAALQEGNIKYVSLIVAGLLGTTIFGLLSMASLELSTNQTNTVNHAVLSSIDLIMAIVGGVALWRQRVQ